MAEPVGVEPAALAAPVVRRRRPRPILWLATLPAVVVAASSVVAWLAAPWVLDVTAPTPMAEDVLDGLRFVGVTLVIELVTGTLLALCLPRRGPWSRVAIAVCAWFALMPRALTDLMVGPQGGWASAVRQVERLLPSVAELLPLDGLATSPWWGCGFAAAWSGVPLVAALVLLALGSPPQRAEQAALSDGLSAAGRLRVLLWPRVVPMLFAAAALRATDLGARAAECLLASGAVLAPRATVSLLSLAVGALALPALWFALRARTAGAER